MNEPSPAAEARGSHFEGHIVRDLHRAEPAALSYGPKDDGRQQWAELPPEGEIQDINPLEYPRIIDRRDETGLIPPLSLDPNPCRERAPIMLDPRGYMDVNATGAGGERLEELPVALGATYVSQTQFQTFAENFKGADGRYVAMTAYGAVPVPDNVLASVPEKFVTKPRYEETETFVLKKKNHDRLTEKAYTQHEHHFVEVVKSGQVEKLIPAGEHKKISIPRYFYKAIIAENIIEGTKYTETPIDVHLRYPPKLVPVRKAIVVQRNIECTKPVVQEKIIERAKIVKRAVPKVLTKEIPFVVPKYVEKIIEVPFRPGMSLPAVSGQVADFLPECPKGSIQQQFPSPQAPQYFGGGDPRQQQQFQGGHRSPIPGPGASPAFMAHDIPGARVEEGVLYLPPGAIPDHPQTIYLPPGVKQIKVPYEAKIDVSVVQAEASGQVQQHGVPTMPFRAGQQIPGQSAMPAMTNEADQHRNLQEYFAALEAQERLQGGRQSYGQSVVSGHAGGYAELSPSGVPMPPPPRPMDPRAAYPVSMDPVVVHDSAGMQNVQYSIQGREPQVLTQVGLRNLSRIGESFMPCYYERPDVLFPPLPQAGPVPLSQGQLDRTELERIQADFRSKMNPSIAEAMVRQQAEQMHRERPSHHHHH